MKTAVYDPEREMEELDDLYDAGFRAPLRIPKERRKPPQCKMRSPRPKRHYAVRPRRTRRRKAEYRWMRKRK